MTGLCDANRRVFDEAEVALKAVGANFVFNPACTLSIPSTSEWSHETLMLFDIHNMTRMDNLRHNIMVQLPGWENSPGAIAEKYVATVCGIPYVEISDVDGIYTFNGARFQPDEDSSHADAGNKS